MVVRRRAGEWSPGKRTPKCHSHRREGPAAALSPAQTCTIILVELMENLLKVLMKQLDSKKKPEEGPLRSYGEQCFRALVLLYMADVCPAAQRNLLTTLSQLLAFYQGWPVKAKEVNPFAYIKHAVYADLYFMLPRYLARYASILGAL